MRIRSLSRLVLAIVFVAPLLDAGTSNLVYTAGQSTAIQTQLIPRYNADHCQRFGLPPSCTSSDLVTAGCTVQTIKSIVLDSCAIFTQDVTGEAAILKEVANAGLIATFNRLITNDNASYNSAECSRFKALSVANQNSECSLRGLPSGCAGPCP
jgi:hypothetical protein